MINLSTKAKMKLRDNQKMLFKADFTLDTESGRNPDYVDKAVLTLTGDDVMGDSVTFTEGTSSSGSFDIGSAIIGSLNLTLNNFNDRFSLYDFANAKMKVWLGVPFDDADTEWFVKGYYTVDKPTSVGNTIPLTMLDNMSRFEVLFSEVKNLTYPIKSVDLLRAICTRCGVLIASSLPRPNVEINSAPDDENITCLDMVSYIAQINGCYARINRDGDLTFGWYDGSEFGNDSGDDINGGTFLTKTKPYSDGDDVDGGTFDHSSETYTDIEGVERVRYANPKTDYDGGTFNWGDYGVLRAFSSFSVGTEDITITGLQFIVDNADENAQNSTDTYLYDKNGLVGNDDTERRKEAMVYALELSGNKLLPLVDDLEATMSYIANKVVGMTFRPFNVTGIANPQYEAGDPVKIISVKGDTYLSYITSITYPLNGYETFNCDAETVSERNSAGNNSLLSTVVSTARTETKKQLGVYDEAVKNLTSLSANALGFYETSEIALDGSRIDYMHEQPTLEESLIAYKRSITGFFIGQRARTDEEFTWIAGIDMNANAVIRTLMVEGMKADWIKTGTLSVGGENNKEGEIKVYGSGESSWQDAIDINFLNVANAPRSSYWHDIELEPNRYRWYISSIESNAIKEIPIELIKAFPYFAVQVTVRFSQLEVTGGNIYVIAVIRYKKSDGSLYNTLTYHPYEIELNKDIVLQPYFKTDDFSEIDSIGVGIYGVPENTQNVKVTATYTHKNYMAIVSQDAHIIPYKRSYIYYDGGNYYDFYNPQKIVEIDNRGLVVNHGKIQLGKKDDDTYNFSVDDDGKMLAQSGKIGAFSLDRGILSAGNGSAGIWIYPPYDENNNIGDARFRYGGIAVGSAGYGLIQIGITNPTTDRNSIGIDYTSDKVVADYNGYNVLHIKN